MNLVRSEFCALFCAQPWSYRLRTQLLRSLHLPQMSAFIHRFLRKSYLVIFFKYLDKVQTSNSANGWWITSSYYGVFWDKYDAITNKLVLSRIGNFIDNQRDITQVKLKCQMSNSLTIITGENCSNNSI